MPKNATILIIRHGEKPQSGRKLSLAGVERAAAYVPYFKNFKTQDGELLAIGHLFAAKSSHASERPVQTITPLAQALGLVIDETVEDGEYRELAKKIREAGAYYDDSTLLICWHHEHALCLAEALGVPKKLPSTLPWPASLDWPPEVFGWVLVITYDREGLIDFARTRCVSTELMYGDCGQDPPGPVY